MAAEEIKRLNYYQRQYLGAADFKAEQAYHRNMRRKHNLAHHTWGIVVGLELVERAEEGTGGVSVFVQPGVAVDGYGREIIVAQPHKLDPKDFSRFDTLNKREIWIAYTEERFQRPASGYESCGDDEQLARVRETYEIVVQPEPPPDDGILVDGKLVQPQPPPPSVPDPNVLSIPADRSVPYQQMEEGARVPRWLVRLGSVNWDGTAGKQMFVAAGETFLTLGRRYLGVVAEEVMSPVKQLRFHPRTLPRLPDGTDAGPDFEDFARVEGRLRVDGRIVAKKDVFLHGSKLSLQHTSGEDEKVPLWLQRIANPDHAAAYDLRIHIGDTATQGDDLARNTRLTIGPLDTDPEKVVLAVRAEDSVDIPTGTLNFGGKVRQMISLWSDNAGKARYGIGVQSGTTYFRTDDQFCWFRGGEHDDNAGVPGAGGTLQLSLDFNACLNFGATTRQMLNLWNAEYGVGVQSATLYFRSNYDFCWFRGGSHSDTRSNPGGGALAMKLSNQGELTVNNAIRTRHVNGKNWANDNDDHLFLNYDTGKDVHIGHVGGLASSLEVSGDIKLYGGSNIVKTRVLHMAVRNFGNSEASWVANYPNVFAEVYTAFAVLQGFSLWNYTNDVQFQHDASHHAPHANAIPQHVYVRLDTIGLNQATGVCFCSESLAANQGDNTVLFTVVVIGRGIV